MKVVLHASGNERSNRLSGPWESSPYFCSPSQVHPNLTQVCSVSNDVSWQAWLLIPDYWCYFETCMSTPLWSYHSMVIEAPLYHHLLSSNETNSYSIYLLWQLKPRGSTECNPWDKRWIPQGTPQGQGNQYRGSYSWETQVACLGWIAGSSSTCQTCESEMRQSEGRSGLWIIKKWLCFVEPIFEGPRQCLLW